mmetsp:Transcript_44347/g.143921  ORF Transcript_44347/g.143921 Transcript_44347/m.143921 type:complete len:230 (-) Transcript_44347:201-890(-)
MNPASGPRCSPPSAGGASTYSISTTPTATRDTTSHPRPRCSRRCSESAGSCSTADARSSSLARTRLARSASSSSSRAASASAFTSAPRASPPSPASTCRAPTSSGLRRTHRRRAGPSCRWGDLASISTASISGRSRGDLRRSRVGTCASTASRRCCRRAMGGSLPPSRFVRPAGAPPRRRLEQAPPDGRCAPARRASSRCPTRSTPRLASCRRACGSCGPTTSSRRWAK